MSRFIHCRAIQSFPAVLASQNAAPDGAFAAACGSEERASRNRFFPALKRWAKFRRPYGAWTVLLALMVCGSGSTADGQTLVYRKVFKGSAPEFTEIKVNVRGKATYDIRSLNDEPDASPFTVSPPVVKKLFELAAQLNHFNGADLDIKRRIANLGQKTFRYEGPEGNFEVTFNYTTNVAGSQLHQLFEGLARQQDHLSNLQRRLRFDRLGVNDALISFEADYNRKIIPEPETLLPVLEQIANDSRVVDIARQRARSLVERIRLAK